VSDILDLDHVSDYITLQRFDGRFSLLLQVEPEKGESFVVGPVERARAGETK